MPKSMALRGHASHQHDSDSDDVQEVPLTCSMRMPAPWLKVVLFHGYLLEEIYFVARKNIIPMFISDHLSFIDLLYIGPI